jgi:hypothetical protein
VSAAIAVVPASMIKFGEEVIISSASVRNSWVIFDANLNMDKHMSGLCRRGLYHIRRINFIRKYLEHDSTSRLISAFFLSLLDNGNSLLVGLTEKATLTWQVDELGLVCEKFTSPYFNIPINNIYSNNQAITQIGIIDPRWDQSHAFGAVGTGESLRYPIASPYLNTLVIFILSDASFFTFSRRSL